MKLKHILPYLAAIILLIGAVFAASTVTHTPQRRTDKNTTESSPAPTEMRGVWVTFMTLDVENEADRKTAFEKKIDTILNDVKAWGLNTLIVQVRPFCDAIYPSDYYPWSHILSGTQGVDPGFDPLQMICDKCRAADIRVHGWINPYRISTASSPSRLSEDNPYVRDKTLGVVVNGETYLNPADERVRTLIVSGVIELLEKYPLDGVQFDDYFYPEECGDFDKADYEAYCGRTASPLSLEEFRKENVNQLIREVYRAVHSTDKSAVFGISPQGNLPNNDVLYADVKRWCNEEGYIDYICPQLYYSLDNPAQRYEDALQEWLTIDRHDHLRMYVGLGAYKAGTDADDGTWQDNHDILSTEVSILREKGCGGFILFSYDSLKEPSVAEELNHMVDGIASPTQ